MAMTAAAVAKMLAVPACRAIFGSISSSQSPSRSPRCSCGGTFLSTSASLAESRRIAGLESFARGCAAYRCSGGSLNFQCRTTMRRGLRRHERGKGNKGGKRMMLGNIGEWCVEDMANRNPSRIGPLQASTSSREGQIFAHANQNHEHMGFVST